ncbi:MAG: HNH endonuclease [Candidatus Binatia bacterium]
MQTDSFTCWYCGKEKPFSEAGTAEHIFLAALGGTLELSTHNVCNPCQDKTGKLDAALPRNWLVEATRLLHGVARRKRIPILNLGEIELNRPERFEIFSAKGAEKVIRITQTRDGVNRAILWLTSTSEEAKQRALRLVNQRLKGHRVIAGPSDFQSEYDLELVKAIMSTSPWKISTKMSLSAPLPVFVKTALALSCYILGSQFVLSQEAKRLREFLWATVNGEDPPELRGAMEMGMGGSVADDPWRVGPVRHSVALTFLNGWVLFHMTVFNLFKAIIKICPAEPYLDRIPSQENLDGWVWLVDPVAKKIEGPLRAFDRMVEALKERTSQAEEVNPK